MNGTDIETALSEFADACVRGGELNLNRKHATLRRLIQESREAIPPDAVPDLSIPGLHLEVCVCVRCGRRRIEHFVESLASRAEACDAYTLDPEKARRGMHESHPTNGADPRSASEPRTAEPL